MARVDGRAFRRTGGRVVVGLAGVLGRAPASWAARELSILTAVNYAPSSDVKLDELAKRFSQAAGVTTRVAHVQSVQMPAKLSAELMAGATRRADPAHHQHLRHPQHVRAGNDQRLQAEGRHPLGRDRDQADRRQEVACARWTWSPSST